MEAYAAPIRRGQGADGRDTLESRNVRKRHGFRGERFRPIQLRQHDGWLEEALIIANERQAKGQLPLGNIKAVTIHASGNICVYASGSLALMEGRFLPRALTV
jgi:hypothetical protein